MLGDTKVIQFPLPPRFWETPGDVPSFRLWSVQFKNDIFLVDSQRSAADKMSDKFKNRLLLSLLRTEGIATFAITPEAQNIATTTLATFFAAA